MGCPDFYFSSFPFFQSYPSIPDYLKFLFSFLSVFILTFNCRVLNLNNFIPV
ncbi:hypothetical protein HMPREF1548_01114 [Clostridium sp. KLE 1755]|nr:hypothetical protein HMPREF1548_01114 [Clostridium sp. KLE 1755]